MRVFHPSKVDSIKICIIYIYIYVYIYMYTYHNYMLRALTPMNIVFVLLLSNRPVPGFRRLGALHLGLLMRCFKPIPNGHTVVMYIYVYILTYGGFPKMVGIPQQPWELVFLLNNDHVFGGCEMGVTTN